jgi:hypothetical protein
MHYAKAAREGRMHVTMKNKNQLKYQTKFNIWGFCVWLYNSIPHFISSGSFSTTFEWISRKTVDGKEAIRKRRPQCFTHSRIWNEFFHYDFLLQEAGNARSRELDDSSMVNVFVFSTFFNFFS